MIMSQRELCEKYGADYLESNPNLKVGISKKAMQGVLRLLHGRPINPHIDVDTSDCILES
jgi:hypothetical protein